MTYPVKWSPLAQEEFAELLEYVELEFSTDAALKLLEDTEEIISKISDFPKMFPVSATKKKIRKAVITKQTSLIYRVNKHEIELLHFWDNRRNTY